MKATTTPTATQKNPAKKPPVSQDIVEDLVKNIGYQGPTLSEALEILQYLKPVLCSGCGYRMATESNQMHQHCVGCRRPGMTYSPAKKGSVLDDFLCKELGKWATYVGLQADG